METKEQRQFKRLHTCKFFRGIMQDVCDAGVSLKSVKDSEAHPYRWACLPDGATMTCAMREYPTQKDLDAHDQEMAKAFENVMVARKAIIEITGGKRNTFGRMPCPVCKTGELRYSVAFNGHVHAYCTSLHCVNWME